MMSLYKWFICTSHQLLPWRNALARSVPHWATDKNNKARASFFSDLCSFQQSSTCPQQNSFSDERQCHVCMAHQLSATCSASSWWVLFINHLFWEMSLLSLGGWNTHTRHPKTLPGVGKAAVPPAQWCWHPAGAASGSVLLVMGLQKFPAPPAAWAQQPGQGTFSCNYCKHEDWL